MHVLFCGGVSVSSSDHKRPYFQEICLEDLQNLYTFNFWVSLQRIALHTSLCTLIKYLLSSARHSQENLQRLNRNFAGSAEDIKDPFPPYMWQIYILNGLLFLFPSTYLVLLHNSFFWHVKGNHACRTPAKLARVSISPPSFSKDSTLFSNDLILLHWRGKQCLFYMCVCLNSQGGHDKCFVGKIKDFLKNSV